MRPNMLRCWLRTLGLPVVICLGLAVLISAPAPAVSEEENDYLLTFRCGSAFVLFPDGVTEHEDFSFPDFDLRIGSRDDSLYAAACANDLDDADALEALGEILGWPAETDPMIESEEIIRFEAFGRPSLEGRGVISFTEDGVKEVMSFRASVTLPDDNMGLVLMSLETDSPVSFDFHVFRTVDATAKPDPAGTEPVPLDKADGVASFDSDL